MPETSIINNWLFAGMNRADQEAVRPLLVRRELRQGELLLRAGDNVNEVHFPVSAIIANVIRFEDGESLEVGSVGREGITGLAAFLAMEPVGWDSIVLVAGVSWSMPAAELQALALKSPDLNSAFQRATHELQHDACRRALCTAFHDVQSRLAHWLLSLQERTGLSTFRVTQGEVADLFGVQRTTIVSAFSFLKQAGALAPRLRGQLAIRDRKVLRQYACPCHGRTPLSVNGKAPAVAETAGARGRSQGRG